MCLHHGDANSGAWRRVSLVRRTTSPAVRDPSLNTCGVPLTKIATSVTRASSHKSAYDRLGCVRPRSGLSRPATIMPRWRSGSLERPLLRRLQLQAPVVRGEPLVEGFGRQRSGDPVALGQVAAEVAEALPGPLVLHPLGADLLAEVVGEVDHRAD